MDALRNLLFDPPPGSGLICGAGRDSTRQSLNGALYSHSGANSLATNSLRASRLVNVEGASATIKDHEQ